MHLRQLMISAGPFFIFFKFSFFGLFGGGVGGGGGGGWLGKKRAGCVFEEEVDNLMHTMINKTEIKKQYNFSVKELSLTP